MSDLFPAILSRSDAALVGQLGERSNFFKFLISERNKLFDDRFQKILRGACADAPRGRAPVKPEVMALALLMQAQSATSDPEAVERAKFDLRWRLVLGQALALPAAPPFSQKTLVFFRRRLIDSGLDGALLLRAARLAGDSKLFAGKNVRALQFVAGRSPLERAARMKVAITQIWRAVRRLVKVLARARPQNVSAMLGDAWRGYACSSKASPLANVQEDEPEAQLVVFRRVVAEARTLRKWLRDSGSEPKTVAAVRATDGDVKHLLIQYVARAANGEVVLKLETYPMVEASTTMQRTSFPKVAVEQGFRKHLG